MKIQLMLVVIVSFFSCLVLHAAAQGSNGGCPKVPPVIPKGIAARLTELTASKLTTVMQRFNELGVTWLRMDFPWNEIQGAGPNSYYGIINYDRVVAAALKYNVSILGIIDYTPPWANGNQDQFYPPLDPQNYARFATYLATRYGPRGVHTWEVWNAPNAGGWFWKPVADPAAYTKLLKLAYVAIKKADPKATVILGGLRSATDQSPTLTPQSFLAAVYRNGGKGYFDAVGLHPFTYPALPNATDGSAFWWTQMYSGMNNVRSIMTANNDGSKKIWITSYGAPTNGGGGSVTEAVQAQMVTIAYKLIATYSWAGPLFWYTYQDSGTDTTNQDYFFGLVRYDGTQKPAYSAYKAAPQSDCVPVTNTVAPKGIAARLTELSASQLESALQRFNELGVTWLRMDFPWNEIQWEGPGKYDVANIDRVVAAAVQHNINILGIIDYCPMWASGGDDQFYPPRNPQDYGNFASYLATRYGPRGVHYWEIWNEPNLGGIFWKPAADPATYTVLLKLAYTAIKKADPKAFVISGGFAPASDDSPMLTPQSFLAAIYQNGGKGYFDAVGHHPYTFPSTPSATDGSAYWWTQMYSGDKNLRSIMINAGDGGKQIWLTEFGAPTNGGGGASVTEAAQAQMVTTAYKMSANYSWAGPLFWYTYQDSGTDAANLENWFGLVRFDGTTKPAYAAYKAVLK